MSDRPKVYAARPGELEDANERYERLMVEAREIVAESVRARVDYTKRANRGKLTDAAMKWLAQVDDHLTTEKPDNEFTVTMLDGRTYQRVMDAPDAKDGLIADEHHARIMAKMRQVVKESVRPQRPNVLSMVAIAVGHVFLASVTVAMAAVSLNGLMDPTASALVKGYYMVHGGLFVVVHAFIGWQGVGAVRGKR